MAYSINTENIIVSAVIVNWQQSISTISTVRALLSQTFSIKYIIVVDNGSSDNSINDIASANLPIILIENKMNGGFGFGCNVGIEFAQSVDSDYVLLINNDAIPDNDTVEKMLYKALSDAEIGVVGAMIIDPDGNISEHSGSIMNPFTFNCRNAKSEFELMNCGYSWVTGAAMLLSGIALQKIGLFDQNFFMYWEDADLCHRLRTNGYKLAIASNAIVCHIAGTSSNGMKIERYSWHLKSQLYWVRKNYKYVYFGLFIVYFRNILKSMLTMNRKRFLMTLNILFKH